MITPELMTYIRGELAKGRNRDAIHADLTSGGGWLPEDIEEAFREIPPAVAAPAPAPASTAEAPAKEAPIVAMPETIAPVVPPNLPIEPIHDPVAPSQPLHPIQPESAPIIPPVITPTPVTPAPVSMQPIVPPVIEPVTPAMAPTITPVMEHSVPAPVAEKSHPYLFWAFLSIIFSGVLLLGVILLNKSLVASLGSLLGYVIPLSLVVITIGVLFASWILHLATKLFSGIVPSGHKAVFVTSVIAVISTLLSVIEAGMHFPMSIVLVLALLALGLQVKVLSETYNIRPIKAFGVAVIQLIILFVFGSVITFVLSVFK